MNDRLVVNSKVERLDDSKSILGFWIYLMTDLVLFASLFATYAVLRNNTFGGPGAAELFSLPFVLIETLLLLASSFTAGLAVLAIRQHDRYQLVWWLIVTFLLGAAFLTMEISEFSSLIREGHGWQASGFLTAFFTLVGTHGLHITIGLVWLIALIAQALSGAITPAFTKRMILFSLFWHFLDIVWVFIFSIVYLMGAI